MTLPAMAQDNPAPSMAGMKMESSATVRTPAELSEGTGKINSIDTEKHNINLTHGPIDALKWPGMTMDFPVAKNVDLSGFKVGDAVTF